MPADPRDDFAIFADSEHMFFGLSDPYAMIREEVENALREQQAQTEVDAITCYDEPKWLTIGRAIDGDEQHVTVGFFGVCFRCTLAVRAGDHREPLEATLTFLFGDVDRPGRQRMGMAMDFHDDAAAAFDDEVFQERFLSFRLADED